MSAVSETPAEATARTIAPTGIARIAILLAGGMLIAFTPQLHTVAFAAVAFAATVAALGLVSLWEASVSPAARRSARVLGAVHLVAAVAAAVIAREHLWLLMLVIALWAAATALCEVLAARRSPSGREGLLPAIMVGLLAVITVLVPVDAIGVIGFFGGYCIIAGVFLAIAAFDPKPIPSSSTGNA